MHRGVGTVRSLHPYGIKFNKDTVVIIRVIEMLI